MRRIFHLLLVILTATSVFAMDTIKIPGYGPGFRLEMLTYVGFEKTEDLVVIRERNGGNLDSITVSAPVQSIFTERTSIAASYHFQSDTIRIPITTYSLTATLGDVAEEIVVTAGNQKIVVNLVGRVSKSNFLIRFYGDLQFGKTYLHSGKTKVLEVVNHASSPITFRLEIPWPFAVSDTLYKMAAYSSLKVPVFIDPSSAIPGDYATTLRVSSPAQMSITIGVQLYDTITTGRGAGPIRFRALESPYGPNNAVYPPVTRNNLLENRSDDDVIIDSMRLVGSSGFTIQGLAPLPQGIVSGGALDFRIMGKSNGDGFPHETIVQMFYTHNGVQGVAETAVFFEPTAALHVLPSPIRFDQVGSSTAALERNVEVHFVGDDSSTTITVDSVWLFGSESGSFSVVGAPLTPIVLGNGESSIIKLRCTPDLEETLSAILYVRGITNWGRQLTRSTQVLCVANPDSTDTATVQPIALRMVANSANIGGTSSAVFTNTTAISAEIATATIALTYNASVLSPITTRVDANDVIDNGMRTSRFSLDVNDHAPGGTLGTVQFLVALGNSQLTPLNVTSVDWYDSGGKRIDARTTVNDTIVSVLDAEGLEVNTVAGPLTLSVSPVPASRSTSVIVHYGAPSVGTLMLYDAMGSVVLDLTHQMTAATGTLSFQTSALSIGTYALRLSAGAYSAVFRILIE